MKLIPDSPYGQLLTNLTTADEVYYAATYVALHIEARTLQILDKTGLESISQILEQEKYKEAITALNAVAVGKKKISINVSNSEVKQIRGVMKQRLEVVKAVPALAREQLVITYATLVEGFVNDTIRNFFVKFPQSLKSNKSTLKDNQLIDSIIEGNTLEKLIDYRVREIMYDSITGWVNLINEKGFSIEHNEDLTEMFLVRNVLIHNNKKVGVELAKEINNKRYVLGKKISVTDKDAKRFKKAIEQVCKEINSAFLKKAKKIDA